MNVTLPPCNHDEEDEIDLNALRVRLQQANAEIDRGERLECICERGIRKLVELQKPGG